MRRNFVYRAAAFVGVLALSALAGRAEAQAGTAVVRGTVIDSTTRQGIPNAQVSIGTTRRVLTDEAGRYSIGALPAGSHTVRVQRIGFGAAERTITLTAGETETVDFTVRPAAAVLSSVVTVGYGTTSRAEVSNAVTQVSGEELQAAAVAGIDAALQGRAAGVQVIQNAGNPGNGITVRVRGSSSISASNQPLYVIDGVPMIREDLTQLDYGGQDLTAVTGLSPSEIETIDVLKDAAAAAIYGSRASNGVVMITTKRGRPGRTRFTVNSYVGQQSLARSLDLMNSQEYVAYMAQAIANDGLPVDNRYRPGITDTIDTDWEDLVTRTAPISDIGLQVQGGGDRFQYMLSGSRFDQPGIIIGSAYDRVNSRLNLDFTATPKFTLRSSVGVARERFDRITNDNTIEGVGANAMAVAPNIPLRRADGTFTSRRGSELAYANPVALAEFNSAPTTTNRLIGSLEAAYAMTENLRLTGRFGADVYDLNERRWESPRVEGSGAAGVLGEATQSGTTATRWLSEAWTNFDPIRNDRQSLALTAGGSVEFNRSEFVYLQGEGFASDAFQYPGSAGSIVLYDGDAEENNLVSFFARANYSLLNRYLLTASVRSDGSSRFAEGKQFGFFPAASVGWTVSDEPIFRGLGDFMSLKLRASFGVTGNQSIPTNFGFLTAYSRANYAGSPGLAPDQLGNPDLRWETTRELDFGTDIGFFDGRLSVIADYYVKNTTDLLVERPISTTSGYADIWDNVGSLRNRGFDLQINTENVRPRAPDGFAWNTSFNVSSNRNEVLSLYRDEPIFQGIDGTSVIMEGEPMGSFWAFEFTGVNPETGDAEYRDVNGNGELDSGDQKIVGNPHPKYYGGLRNELRWRGFDFTSFFEFTQGKDVLNLFRQYSDDGGATRDNKLASANGYWRQPGDVTDEPRPSRRCNSLACLTSSRFVEDGSYVRLQEITLGYRLPARVFGRAGLSDTRLYVTGRNLALWTDYSGYDPDVNSYGSGNNTSPGVEFYAYPRARAVSVGVTTSW